MCCGFEIAKLKQSLRGRRKQDEAISLSVPPPLGEVRWGILKQYKVFIVSHPTLPPKGEGLEIATVCFAGFAMTVIIALVKHLQKQRLFSLFCLTVFCVATTHTVHAVSNRQYRSNSGLPPRSTEEIYRKKTIKKRSDTDATYKSFHIHKDFECKKNDTVTSFSPYQLSLESAINSDDLAQYPLTFAITMEIIKAHLETVFKSYYLNGIDFDNKKYEIRYHTEEERSVYPEEVALEAAEQAKIYYPDALRSAAYIYYIIMPMLKDFMTNAEYGQFERIMSINAFNTVLSSDKNRIIWHYRKYVPYIKQTYKILNTIEARYLKNHSLSRRDVTFQKQIINALLYHNWASFLAVRSCALIEVPKNPLYDNNFYADTPISRDNYLMGLGIFQRIKKLTKHYLWHNDTVTTITKDNPYYPLREYIDFFENFYKTTEPPISDTLPDTQIEKLQTHAVCSLGLDLEGCGKRNKE